MVRKEAGSNLVNLSACKTQVERAMNEMAFRTKIDSQRNEAPFKAYFTEAELAERLAVSVKVLQKWRQTAEVVIPYAKFGSLVRYPRTDVLAWEAAAMRSSTSDQG
jgi:excisionase family DNA binding protein